MASRGDVVPRVYLHVGVPLSAERLVRATLWRERERLVAHGVCYPGDRDPWDRLVATVRRSGAGTAVISSEQLAVADTHAAQRAVDSFPKHDVHVVLTIRDLSRRLVAGWQDQLRRGSRTSLDAFLTDWLDGRDHEQVIDPVAVLDRWRLAVPAGRVHVVTVPPAGAPAGLLWQRFAAVASLDPDMHGGRDVRGGADLDVAAAELLRRYNAAFASALDDPHHAAVVGGLLADRVLPGGDGRPQVLPARFVDPVDARSRATVEELRRRGPDVTGDLGDLAPDPHQADVQQADGVEQQELAAAGARAVAVLLTELGPLRRRLEARRPRPSLVGRVRGRLRRTMQRTREPDLAPPLSDPGPVFVHVGAPKTGTTFLQDIMWRHREQLSEAGVLFTRRRFEDHFRATLDLRQIPGKLEASAGAWDQVVADSRGWAGTSVISHELFAGAQPQHVARAIDTLGPDRVHVVYTVRDLWGLLSAEWQEATKHGNTLSFKHYLADVFEHRYDGVVADWFWLVHDPVDVLARWGATLPRERVHVITVPPSGTEPMLLWRRFAGLLGVDPDAFDTSVARPNTSLGGQEVTFLRYVNERLGGRNGLLTPGQYSRFVKELLAQRVLAARADKKKYEPPLERFDQAQRQAEDFVAALAAAGYSVVGGLDELVPQAPSGTRDDPDATSPAELVDVGLDALAGLVSEAVQLRATHGVGGQGR